MNSLFVISIVSWIGMWFAFHLGHPVGYVIPIIGLAAAVAIALEARSPQADTEVTEAIAAGRHETQQRSASPNHQKDRVFSAAQRRRTAEARQSTEVGQAA